MQAQKVIRSPTTLQYHIPINKPTPYYKRRFIRKDGSKASLGKTTLSSPSLSNTDPLMPPYPYGKNYAVQEANEGLYGGATIQSGNKISDGRNKGKTVRKWYPNVRVESLRSEALERDMSIPVVARVMRTIRKCGGLDQYLLGDKPARIKELGLLGWKLRWQVMNTKTMRERFAAERANLGLPVKSPTDESFEAAWEDPDTREELTSKLEETWEDLREKDNRYQKHIKETLKWEDEIPKMTTLQEFGPRSFPHYG